eukprot:s1269_g13.t1
MDSRVLWRVFWGDGDSRGIFPRQFVAFVPFAKAVDQGHSRRELRAMVVNATPCNRGEVPVIEQRLSALLLLLMTDGRVVEVVAMAPQRGVGRSVDSEFHHSLFTSEVSEEMDDTDDTITITKTMIL